jgi:mRNA interferase RelE/StbE
LDSKIVNQPNPRVIGKQLIGTHKDKWSYRIGDYRLLVQIQDEKFIILAIDVGHRKQIYKKF